jgi:hypothetical protein
LAGTTSFLGLTTNAWIIVGVVVATLIFVLLWRQYVQSKASGRETEKRLGGIESNLDVLASELQKAPSFQVAWSESPRGVIGPRNSMAEPTSLSLKTSIVDQSYPTPGGSHVDPYQTALFLVLKNSGERSAHTVKATIFVTDGCELFPRFEINNAQLKARPQPELWSRVECRAERSRSVFQLFGLGICSTGTREQ